MKKTLSIVLSFCILLASLSGTLLGTAFGSGATSDPSHFVDAANWQIYFHSGTLGVAGDSWADSWEKITNINDFEGKSVVVKATARDQISAIPFTVEANKNYTLTFKYFVDSAATMTALRGVGVYTAGATFSNGDYASGGAALGLAAPEIVSGQWKEVKIDFASGENTEVYFAAYWLITDQTINFADFALAETLPDVNYYENGVNWGVYGKGAALDGTKKGNTHNGWMTATTVYGYEGKNVATSVAVRDAIPALAIPVEANRQYKFTLSYFVPNTATYHSYFNDSYMGSIGIYAPNSVFNGDPATYTSGGAVLGTATGKQGATGEWAEIEIEFESKGNTTVYFAGYFIRNDSGANGNMYYFADYKLTEIVDASYFENSANWGVYGKGAAVDGSQKGNTHNGWMTATTVPSYEGKKAISVAVRDAIPTLAIPVEANKYYKFTLSYFVPDTATYHSYFNDSYMGSIGIYASGSVFTGDPAKHTSGGAVLGTAADKQGATGEWAEIEINFNSKENTTVYFAGYFIRNDSGANANRYYFADFELEEIAIDYYENAANWKLYPSNGTLGGSPLSSDWMKATTVTEFEGKDVAVNASIRDAMLAIPFDVKAYTQYELSFKYFVTNESEYHTNLVDTFMKPMGVYSLGSSFSGGNFASGATLGTATDKADAKGEWKEIKINFNSLQNTKAYFAAYCLINVTNSIYLADFALEEVDTHGWQGYLEGSKVLGTGGNYSAGFVSQTTEDDKDGDGKTFKVEANNYCQFATYKLEGLKKDTYYNLTFYYKAAAATNLDYTGGLLSHIYVLKDGGENVQYSTDHLGGVVRGSSATSGYYLNKHGLLTTRMDGTLYVGEPNKASNTEWNKLTVSFYSNNETMALLALRLSVYAPIYVDGFDLKEADAPFKNYDSIPAKGWNGYLEWTPKFGAGGTLSGATIEEVSDKVYTGPDGDGDGKAIRIAGNNIYQWATKKLEGLETDTYYKLTMYYWSQSTGANGNVFSDIRVVKDGGKNDSFHVDNLGRKGPGDSYYTNKHGLAVPLSDDATELKTADTTGWNKVEILFYSGDSTTAQLAMRPIATKSPLVDAPLHAQPVYVDGISIEKTSSKDFRLIDQEPNPGWGGKQDVYTVDFEDEDFYVHLLHTENRMRIEKAPDRDGKSTNAIHLIPGKFYNATCLNWATVSPNPGRDPVFTMPVDENQKYTISYWLYVEDDGQEQLNYFTFYYDYADANSSNPTWTTHTGMREKGKWVRFETSFFTNPGQTECSLFFNAATNLNADLWVDDIVLRKINAGTVISEPDKSYCETPYNLIKDDTLKDVSAAKSGVYKFKLKKNVSYVFGATAGSDKKSDSRMFLSFDGVNPMPKNGDTAPSPIIEANGKMERYGINFDSGNQEYVYLVIENDDGKLKIEDPTLFIAFYTTTIAHKGYAENPNVELATHTGELGGFGKVEVEVESSDDTQNDDMQSTDNEQQLDNQDDEIGESPETGSVPVLPIIILFITTLFACIALLKTKKGGEQI